MKSTIAAGLAVTMATLGTANAHARGGWPIAAGIFGGLAVGTAIGATVASANTTTYVAPSYYYPQTYAVAPAPVVQPVPQTYVQPAPQYVAPTPVYVQTPAPVVYYSTPVVYPAPYCYAPAVHIGFGYGYGYRYGYHYGHRR